MGLPIHIFNLMMMFKYFIYDIYTALLILVTRRESGVEHPLRLLFLCQATLCVFSLNIKRYFRSDLYIIECYSS